MALHSLYCADVPLRNCSLTHSLTHWWNSKRHNWTVCLPCYRRHNKSVVSSLSQWLQTSDETSDQTSCCLQQIAAGALSVITSALASGAGHVGLRHLVNW